MIKFTENAVQKVLNVQATKPEFEGKPFRVFIQAGGCSGYNYGFNFDEIRDDDQITDIGPLKVVVDPKSLKYIEGSEVDWVEDFTGSGFRVKNPLADASCGCGISFNVKEDE